MRLFYLATPRYGGWVSFTVHLARALAQPFFQVGNRTDTKWRDFGYGVKYKNVAPTALKNVEDAFITAVDNCHYGALEKLPGGTLVIHDPTELKPGLLKFLPKFNLVTVRPAVYNYLLRTYGYDSKLMLHPFMPFHIPDRKKEIAISTNRIDFDKHTEITLQANAIAKRKVELWGAANRRYIHFNLQGMDFEKYYKGQFPREWGTLSTLLARADLLVDMSQIKNDGGGTQYTFLEAIHAGAALVLHKAWVSKGETFIPGENCFSVETPEELASVLDGDPLEARRIAEAAKPILQAHGAEPWRELCKKA